MPEYEENVIAKQNRQIFKMPLRAATVLFSILLFAAIALCSLATYYFAMRNILGTSSEHEIKQVLNTRQIILNAKLDKEILMLKVLSEAPIVVEYFLSPNNEDRKKEAHSVLEHYTDFFHNKILSWINIKDSIYYVNGQPMEKYEKSNRAHSWFYDALEYERPPLIRVAFDYLNRQIYDIYIDYPVYYNGEAIGVICSRISLFEFVSNLNLPENTYVFDRDGVVVGAADEKIAKERKTLKELFGSRGEEVHKRALNLGKNPRDSFSVGNRHYLINNTGDLDLFLVSNYEINIRRIMQERASIVFFALLFIIFLVFIIFNIFIAYVLKPMNKNLLLYVKSSLLDELTRLPNRRFFNMRMEDEWSRAIRDRLPLSFLMLDLDKFKNYNDTRGHLEGDALLRDVARIFRNSINRASDFAARFGGEEFCVVLPNTKKEGALEIAESIRASVEKAGKITVSIGLVCKVPDLEDNYKDFMEEADQKLYEAKSSGRNRVCM